MDDFGFLVVLLVLTGLLVFIWPSLGYAAFLVAVVIAGFIEQIGK